MEQTEQERFFTKEGKLACVSLTDGTHYIGKIVYERTPTGNSMHTDMLEEAVQVDVDFEKLEDKIKRETEREFNNQPKNLSKENERRLASKGRPLIKNPSDVASFRFYSEIARLYEEGKSKMGGQIPPKLECGDEIRVYFATTHLQ